MWKVLEISWSPSFFVYSEGICPRSLCPGRRGAGTVCYKVLGGGWGKWVQNSINSSILSSPNPAGLCPVSAQCHHSPNTRIKPPWETQDLFTMVFSFTVLVRTGLMGVGEWGWGSVAMLIQHLGLHWSYLGYDPWTRSMTLSGSLSEMQNLRSRPGSTDSESVFEQDPQVIAVHLKVWEALPDTA